MKLCWTHPAFADRDGILDHIAKDDVVAALAIDDRIIAAIEHLQAFPELGRIGRVAGTRELVVSQTKYVVVYSFNTTADTILILRILHGAQDWPGDAI